ncbi:hypothetical protein Pelsub_P1259 [Pelolinea submarina]|nr:hypothetical protein Pelsub_P1259 [Pelolinea submarina]
MLNPDFIEIGIACFLKPKKNAFDFNNVYYWGQNFGTRVSPKSFGPLMERYLPKKIKKQTEDITVTILNEDKIEIK